MLSREKANMPATTNTSRPSSTSGRRVRTNCSTPRSKLRPFQCDVMAAGRVSTRRRGKRIAQEQRAFAGDQFADLHATENLPVAVTLLADRHRAPGKMAAVGGDPRRRRAVAFAHHAVERNGRRAYRRADADDEGGEHARAQ